VEATDGRVPAATVLLDRFEKTLKWLRDTLQAHGISLAPTAGKEWEVRP
jgi:D-serine deaminase-like pyridoxal phosphate-dependent protein